MNRILVRKHHNGHWFWVCPCCMGMAARTVPSFAAALGRAVYHAREAHPPPRFAVWTSR